MVYSNLQMFVVLHLFSLVPVFVFLYFLSMWNIFIIGVLTTLSASSFILVISGHVFIYIVSFWFMTFFSCLVFIGYWILLILYFCLLYFALECS